MPEQCTPGIDVEENPFAEQFISPAPASITAFVGRTVMGPPNKPVTVRSFLEYQRTFGGLWIDSPLSYSVKQYFEHGGQVAIVVRVANGATGSTLLLPGEYGSLTLTATNPGSREALRASVDYDNISSKETGRFNLLVQRVRNLGSELVAEQETYRSLSTDPESDRFVTSVLDDSNLARVAGVVPAIRPKPTVAMTAGSPVSYVDVTHHGCDGKALSDYDVIGSEVDGTGLFALKRAGMFNLLYVPPLGRKTDIGPLTLLVAQRFCKRKRVLLLVDPPSGWQTVDDALVGFQRLNFASENAVMYYPWLVHRNPEDGTEETFPPSAAVAGAMSKTLLKEAIWEETPQGDSVLRSDWRPGRVLSRRDARRLRELGVNPIIRTCHALHEDFPPRTLAGPECTYPDWRSLASKRLTLHILESVECGTKWVIFERNNARTRKRVKRRVEGFLHDLYCRGAFKGKQPEESYFVLCDAENNTEVDVRNDQLNLLIGFTTMRPGDFRVFNFSHTTAGTRVMPCSLSRRVALAC